MGWAGVEVESGRLIFHEICKRKWKYKYVTRSDISVKHLSYSDQVTQCYNSHANFNFSLYSLRITVLSLVLFVSSVIF